MLTDAETMKVNGEVVRLDAYDRTPCGKAVVIKLKAGSYVFEQA